MKAIEANGLVRADRRKPNFFIVGAPKCGTTSLWKCLRGHPDIYMPAQKELYFFDSDLWANMGWAPSLDQYLDSFSAASHQKKIGEATPSYLRSQRAPQEIQAFSPGAQIIVMLRNPVDVMYSLHSQGLRFGNEPIVDFESALQADGRRANADLQGYREFTDFPAQVQRYFDLFGRENVHVIIYDDLTTKPAATYQSTLRFLGVRPDGALEFPRVNQNQQIRSMRLQMILRRPPLALRKISRALVPQRLRPRVQRVLLNSNLIAGLRAPMNPILRKRLQREFEPKVEQLSTLLGRDLSAWCKELTGENTGEQ